MMPGADSARRSIELPQWRRAIIVAVSAFAFAAWNGAAQAGPNLVQNGGFEQASLSGSYQFGTGYESGGSPVDTLTNWATGGYNFVFQPGTASTTGSTGSNGALKLWGPGDGSSNGLPASSPAGGNFIAADGAYEVGAITQTVIGLVPGEAAVLTFYWAGAQQSGFTGATTDQWQVSLGSQTLFTPVVSLPSQGFSGWVTELMTFTPTSNSEVLSFTAIGTPNGEPPFALLDGVSLTVPEPASWAVMVSGITILILYARRRRKSASARMSAAVG
jgi:hypothetical protein